MTEYGTTYTRPAGIKAIIVELVGGGGGSGGIVSTGSSSNNGCGTGHPEMEQDVRFIYVLP